MEPVTITTFAIIKLAIKFAVALGVVALVGGGINSFNKNSFKLKKGGSTDVISEDDPTTAIRRH